MSQSITHTPSNSGKPVKSPGGLGRGIGDMSHFKDYSSSLKNNPIAAQLGSNTSIDTDVTKVLPIKNISKSSNSNSTGKIAMIPIGLIQPNKDQPRRTFDEKTLGSLVSSINELGIIQPITVRKLSAIKYQIISGERRFRASQKAGLEEIPAYVRIANDQQLLKMALVENVQREDLHPIEIASSFERLQDECGLSHSEIGTLVGKARASVSNQLRLLELPEAVKIELGKKTLSQGHAKALLAITNNPERQILIMNLAISQKFSVRQTEELCKKDGGRKKLLPKVRPLIPALTDDEIQDVDTLRIRYPEGVSLKKDYIGGGRVEFHFKNKKQLQDLLDKLTGTS